MKKIAAFLCTFTFLVFHLGTGRAQYSPQDYAEGAQLLTQIQQKAATRKPVTNRPYVFIRSQTKYSGRMYLDTYLWHDRPLFASRKLWDDGGSDHKVASFARNFELYQSYGLDGYASFAWPGEGEFKRTMSPVYETAAKMKLDPKRFNILLETSHIPSYLEIDKGTFDLITQNPYSFRINGKSVLSSYVMDNMTPEEIAKYVQPLRERSGDKLLFLPMIHFIHLKDEAGRATNIHDIHELYRLNKGSVPASILRPMQEYLRTYARISDGLYIGPEQVKLDRSADDEFAREILYPLFKSVLAEPEFSGKLFATQAKVGYTSYHNSQHLSRNGTKTLRGSFDLAEEFQPDLMIGNEWDELNEDTGFEPLVAKPMSSQRIIKYYMSRFKKQAPTPNPGDDLSLPNIIISQRRQLVPGDTLGIELLNVPDTLQGQPYSLWLQLLDENDKILYHSPPQRFNTAKLEDKTLNLPSEKFKDARALRPRLTLDYRGKKRVLETGLPFTVLRATTDWDQTWFCTPIRNVLQAPKSSIQFGPQVKPVAPGVSEVELTADVQAGEELAYVEVVQDSQEVFAYDRHNEYRQNDPDRRLLRLSWDYVNQQPLRIHVNFTADLKGAPGATTFALPIAGTVPNSNVPNVKATASPAFTDSPIGWNKNRFYGPADWFDHSRLISLSTEEMKTGVLTIEGVRTDGPRKDEKFSWTLPLSELGEYGVISKVFEDGLNFVVQTQYRPTKLPLPLETKTVQFKQRIIADNPNGVLALRAITSSGKVFWSKPFAVNTRPGGPTVPVQVYASSAKKGITLPLPQSRVPHIKYDFTPRWGNILHTDAGRQFYGHAGSYLTTATAFSGGESAAFNIPFYLFTNNIFKGADKPAPEWVQIEGGQWALDFDGKRGNFLALPNIAIPQRTGYTVSFDIKPRQIKPAQVLFANEAYSYGTFNLSVKDGKFVLFVTRRTPDRPDLGAFSQMEFKTNIPLHADQWQKVTLSYDETKLTLTANNQTESFPFEGIGLYLQQSVFGGRGGTTKDEVIPFFDGLLRALEIKHYGE